MQEGQQVGIASAEKARATCGQSSHITLTRGEGSARGRAPLGDTVDLDAGSRVKSNTQGANPVDSVESGAVVLL